MCQCRFCGIAPTETPNPWDFGQVQFNFMLSNVHLWLLAAACNDWMTAMDLFACLLDRIFSAKVSDKLNRCCLLLHHSIFFQQKYPMLAI